MTNKLTILNSNPRLNKSIQLIAFDRGYIWNCQHSPEIQYLNKENYAFYADNKRIYFNSQRASAASKVIDTLLDAQTQFSEIVSWFQENHPLNLSIEVNLGNHMYATLTKNTVKIVGEVFNIDIIDRLYKAKQNMDLQS